MWARGVGVAGGRYALSGDTEGVVGAVFVEGTSGRRGALAEATNLPIVGTSHTCTRITCTGVGVGATDPPVFADVGSVAVVGLTLTSDTDLSSGALYVGTRIGLTATIDTALSRGTLNGRTRLGALSIDGSAEFIGSTRACPAGSNTRVVLAATIKAQLVGLCALGGLGVTTRRHATIVDADIGRGAIEIDFAGLAINTLSRNTPLT